jgi:hypothetical protein
MDTGGAPEPPGRPGVLLRSKSAALWLQDLDTRAVSL